MRSFHRALLLSLAIAGLSAPAAAQFNAKGRGKKPKPSVSAPRAPARPNAPRASERAAERAAQPEAARTSERSGPSSDALIARYSAIALSQPSSDFPVQRLAELYRARDGKLDAWIDELTRKIAQGGPERPALLLILAGALRQDSKPERAIQTYEQALKETPGSVVAELGLARLYSEHSQPEQARRHYQAALPLITEATLREQVLRSLMTLCLDARDVPAAKQYHDELVKRQGGSFFVKAELGRELYTRALYAEAAQAFSELVKAGQGDNRVLAPALRDYGRALAKIGKRAEAVATLERALGVAGSQAGVRREIYATIVELYREDDRLPELIASIEKRGARDSEEQRLLASLYEETGKPDKALAGYRKVLQQEGKDIATRLKVVHILEVQGELEQAVREYEALAKAAPRNPDFVFRLAEALIQRGDRKRALEQLQALEARSGDEQEILSALVDFYERMGEKTASLALLQRLSARGGTDLQHLVELGARYWQDGDKKKAVTTWQRIRTAAKDRGEGLLTLGEVYIEHDMAKEALELLDEAARLEPKQLRFRKAYAVALERAGASAGTTEQRLQYHERALKLWEQILQDNGSQSPAAREARQHIITLWSLSGALAPRSVSLRRRLDATPPDLDAGRLLAEAEMRLRRYGEAERTLTKIVTAAPGDVESLSWLERVLNLQHNLPRAIEVLERLARAEPRRAREFYQRMADYAAELYRDDDAIRYAARAVELGPEDAEGHRKLGAMYQKRGDLSRAISELRLAIAKNERLFWVHFDLAELLLGQGQADEADLLLRRVVRTAPDEELIARAARLSLQINLGRNSVEALERDLLPLSLDNPDRPIYRRLLVELYGTLSYPLLHRALRDNPEEAEPALAELRRLGERAVKPLLDALGDSRDSQQEVATTLLTYVANKSAGPALLAYAGGNAEPRLRARAMLAVGALGDVSLVPRLAEIVAPGGRARSEGADPVLLAAAWSLCRTPHPSARAPLTALSESPAPGLRFFGVLGLALLGDKSASPVIARVLASNEAGPLPRAAAAFAAGQLGLSQLANQLAELTDSANPELAKTALIALSRLKSDLAAERIAVALLSGNADARPATRAAALVLATGSYRRSGPWLPIPNGELDLNSVLAALTPDAYDAAAERQALTRLSGPLEVSAERAVRSSPEAARSVVEALTGDSERPPFAALLQRASADPEARRDAERLAEQVARRVVTPLVALAEHPAEDVRSFALAFLSRRQEPNAVRAVVAAVEDGNPVVRRAAFAVLRPWHNAAAPRLIASSRAVDWSERAAAVDALGRIVKGAEPPEALRRLTEAASEDPTALVRETALNSLFRAAPNEARATVTRARDSDPELHVRQAAAALLRGLPNSER